MNQKAGDISDDVVVNRVEKGEEERNDDDDEVPWRDDRIRWAEDFENEKNADSKKKFASNHGRGGDGDNNEDESSDEEETAFLDPFKDPDPFQIFDFDFVYSDISAVEDELKGSNNGSDCEAKTAEGDPDTSNIHISLRGYKKDADQVWTSTGCTLWRASEYLCSYLVRRQQIDDVSSRPFHKGKRILELGAGLGLVGLVAHQLAGSDSTVCITDGDVDALVLLRENIEKNTASTTTRSLAKSSGRVSARQLIWGHDTAAAFLERHCEGQPFDLLLASDIVYALVIVEPLWETVRLLLRKPNKQQQDDHQDSPSSIRDRPSFMMAYAKRDVPVTIEIVLQAATKAGFSYELVDEDPEGIWIYNFWWSDV